MRCNETPSGTISGWGVVLGEGELNEKTRGTNSKERGHPNLDADIMHIGIVDGHPDLDADIPVGKESIKMQNEPVSGPMLIARTP